MAGPNVADVSAAAGAGAIVQGTLDELGTPLADVTFVVVDLETTGGSPADCGDHRDRRGQGPRRGGARRVPDPGRPGPPDPAVHRRADRHHQRDGGRRARASGAALPAFLEFARRVPSWSPTTRPTTSVSCKAPATAPGRSGRSPRWSTPPTWPATWSRDEARNRRLGTLARLFRSPTTPEPPRADRRPRHRRRPARAAGAGRQPRRAHPGRTAQLQLEGAGHHPAQAHTWPTACPTPRASTCSRTTGAACSTSAPRSTSGPGSAATSPPPSTARRMRRWSPWPPGSPRWSALTALEARVRELRLIAEHAPPYNRRSRLPERAPWVKLTAEPFPRLSVVRQVRADGATYLGPFGCVHTAELAVAALHEAFQLRQCCAAGCRDAPARRVRLPAGRSRPVRRALHRRQDVATYDAGRRPGPARDRPRRRPVVAAVPPPARQRLADRRALRGGRRAPGPAAGLRQRGGPGPAAGPAGRDARADRRPARRARAAGSWCWSATGGWPAPALSPPGARPAPAHRGAPRLRRRRPRPGHLRCRPRTPPRPSRSWAGWSSPASGWSRRTASWACPVHGAAGVSSRKVPLAGLG